MFSSTISKEDANNKAWAYIYQQSNEQGACVSAPVTINFHNNVYDNNFYIELCDSNNQPLYTFEVTASDSYKLGGITPGTYNIRVCPRYGENDIYY